MSAPDDTAAPRMAEANKMVDAITKAVGERFATFGGKRGRKDNPIAAALDDGALVFAAGVDVRDVVIFAVAEWLALARGETNE